MANGYHAVPTETARRLLSDIAKMAVGLDDKMKGHTTLKYSKVAAVAAAAGASESMRMYSEMGTNAHDSLHRTMVGGAQ